MKIEEKLDALARCGLELKPQFGVQDLVETWGRQVLDEPGWNLALVCLGMTEEKPPWTPHCDNLWHFDTECIEDNGDYVRIAKRMSEMAGGSLPISEVQDHVDIEEGAAWLQFNFQGKPLKINCKVDNDKVDPALFSHFVDLLAKCDRNKVFIYFDLGGQDCILGCVMREQFAALQKIIPEMQALI